MFGKLACSSAIFAVASIAEAAHTNDPSIQTSCVLWTPAVPQSMPMSTGSCSRVSWIVDLGRDIHIMPYRYIDSEPNFRSQSATPVFAGGAVINSRLSVLPGKPVLAFDIGSRGSAIRWNPTRDPIWMTSVSLGYQASMNIELGPHVTQTWNTFGDQARKTRTYGLYFKGKF